MIARPNASACDFGLPFLYHLLILYMTFNDVPHIYFIFYWILLQHFIGYILHAAPRAELFFTLWFFFSFLFFINAVARFISVSTVQFVFYFFYWWIDDYLQVWLTNLYTYAVGSVHHMGASLGREREWVSVTAEDGLKEIFFFLNEK